MELTPEVKELLEKIFSDPGTEIASGTLERLRADPEFYLLTLLQRMASEIADRPLLRSTVSGASFGARRVLNERGKKSNAA